MIYFAVLLFLFILSVKFDGKKSLYLASNQIAIFSVIILMVLIAGLSKNIGGDVYYTYWPEYRTALSIDQISWDHVINPGKYWGGSADKYKPLYLITRSFFRTFSSEFWVYHVFHALFINLCIFYFLRKRTPYLCLALIFYCLINFLEYNTEIIRESIAIVFSLIGFNYLERNKKVPYVIMCFIAYSFHTSGLITFLFPFAIYLGKLKFKYTILVFIALSFCLTVVFESLDLGRIIKLMEAVNSNEAAQAENRLNQELNSEYTVMYYFTHYLQFLFFPLALAILNPNRKEFKYQGFVYIYLLLQIMNMYGVIFYRLANYFAPFYWLFLSFSIYGATYRFSKKLRNSIILIVLGLFFFMQTYYMRGTDNSGLGDKIYERYYPYKSVIFD